jgi:hypothetical protein
MGTYIDLYHGHHSSDEELESWGFLGPILGPFNFCHITYASHIHIGDTPILVHESIIEFPGYDENGFLQFLGGYYGDMSVFSEDSLNEYPTLKFRWERTKEFFALEHIDLPKYINAPDEWVKHYASCKLKGLI